MTSEERIAKLQKHIASMPALPVTVTKVNRGNVKEIRSNRAADLESNDR